MWRLHAPATTAEAIFVMLEKTHETASAVEAGSIVFKNAAKLLSELFGFAKYLRKNAPFFFRRFVGVFRRFKIRKNRSKSQKFGKLCSQPIFQR